MRKQLFAELSKLRMAWAYLKGHPGFRRAPIISSVRLMTWRVRCGLRIPAVIKLRAWNAEFWLPPKWNGAGTTMIFAVRERYETELTYLSRFLSPGDGFVDAGANCGIYTIAAARLVGPGGVVLSFEPGSDTFSVLSKNIRLNRCPNVRAFHTALSDRDGTTRLYHHEHGPNSFSLGSNSSAGQAFEDISTRTLDHVLKDEGVQNLKALKLDVEGAELLVLLGGQSVLHTFHPVVIFEINREAAGRLSIPRTGAWDHLSKNDYHFFQLSPAGELCRLYTCPEGGNVIALWKGLE